MISVKCMKPINITSSLSNIEKMRLNLFLLREAFYLIASVMHNTVVYPRLDPIRFGWHNGNESQVQLKLPGFPALIRPIHQQAHGTVGLPKALINLRPSGAS